MRPFPRPLPCARAALLASAFATAGAAMTYEPFPLCTEQAQVDSVRTRVYLDEAMDPAAAPYPGYMKFAYHAGTCFPRRTEQKPYYLDHVLIIDFALSADRRRLDMQWQTGAPPDSLSWGSSWYDENGKPDSSRFNEYRHGSEGARLVTEKETRLRTPQYQTIKTYYRIGEGPWELYSSDSIVAEGGGVAVHSVEDGERYVTRCAPEGATYACKASSVGPVSFPLEDQVWYLTGGRVDSLRTYDDQGRHRSTDVYFWSPRTGAALRRLPRSGTRPSFDPRRGAINAKGQILAPFRPGSSPYRAYFPGRP